MTDGEIIQRLQTDLAAAQYERDEHGKALGVAAELCQTFAAENAQLLADRTKAGRSIYEAQLHAYSVLEYSGATKVDHKDRTPEQAAAVELYSYVHDAAKMLVGRPDIEHGDQRALASELKVELAVVRTALAAAEQALAEVRGVPRTDIGNPERCNAINPRNNAHCELPPTAESHYKPQTGLWLHRGTHGGDVTRWEVERGLAPWPAAPSASSAHGEQPATQKRSAALTDMEHILTLALQAMAENDCCADPDDPDWRGPAIEQFRNDLRALGVSDDEMNAHGLVASAHDDDPTGHGDPVAGEGDTRTEPRCKHGKTKPHDWLEPMSYGGEPRAYTVRTWCPGPVAVPDTQPEEPNND